MSTPEESIARFGETLGRLDAEIDWDVIASVVCEGDAAGFFSDERREAIVDAGLKHAADLGDALERQGGPKRSLYVGAAVAELPVLLFEAIVLGRKVRWVTLRSAESDELDRALREIDESLPRPRTQPWGPDDVGRVSHVWMASVLTDPEAFPALHDELYGLRGRPESVGGGHPKAERTAARDLVERCLDTLAPAALEGPGAFVTTSNEELAVWLPLVEARGWHAQVPREGRLSGLVGDVLHRVRVTRSGTRKRR